MPITLDAYINNLTTYAEKIIKNSSSRVIVFEIEYRFRRLYVYIDVIDSNNFHSGVEDICRNNPAGTKGFIETILILSKKYPKCLFCISTAFLQRSPEFQDIELPLNVLIYNDQNEKYFSKAHSFVKITKDLTLKSSKPHYLYIYMINKWLDVPNEKNVKILIQSMFQSSCLLKHLCPDLLPYYQDKLQCYFMTCCNLTEIIALGLIQNSKWSQFLKVGLYDPRLFLYISEMLSCAGRD